MQDNPDNTQESTKNEQYRLLVEGAQDYAMILLDSGGRVTAWNTGAERIFGWTAAETVGRPAHLIFTPEDCAAGVPEEEMRKAGAEGRALDLRWHLRKDGTRFWADGIMEGLTGRDGHPRGFAKILRDATEVKRAQDALQDSEARLRGAQARLDAALAAGGIATWDWDLVSGRIAADANVARLFSVSPEDAANGRPGAYLRAIHPDDRPRVDRAIEEAVTRWESYEVECRVMLPGGSHRWLAARGRVERDAGGKAVSLPGVVVDVTERVERERRVRLLADLADRARALTDPDAVITDAVHSVGGFLGVSRCIFADIDIEADTCAIHPHYRADDSVADIEGVVPISAFGAFVVAEYAARRAVAVDDVRLDTVRAPGESQAAYEAIGIRAHITVPVVHSGRLVSCISVHNAAPRHWEPEEVELLRTVVEQTWLTVEVLRQQRALAREAEGLREAHARTGRILESITDAFMAFDREWRFTHVNDQYERVMSRTRGELLGRSFWDEFPDAVGSTFEREYRRAVDEQVAVSFEEFYPALNVWVEVRAYPSPDGLSVFYQDVSARKALETERDCLAERERNIARQLQAALTPSIPERVPGMALTRHYQAALDEAGVGGDFYDVFPVEKGCTALVVGDVSGKGLAAAAQVATVRNMLRYALYRARTLSGALEGLNALLTEQGLLSGFATLFVGAYDSGAGTLTYVNCGQEPALVRCAATGVVEELPPTGPVLGSLEGAVFAEGVAALGPGDVLAVFTDGLTEVGPTRLEMLGIEGMAALLGQPVSSDALSDAPFKGNWQAADLAERLRVHLIGGVDRFAQGGVMRDDMCLLVGVVEG